MKEEIIHRRDDLVIRRGILEPGEATPWHTDPCRRFTVVVRGDALAIEYRDGRATERFAVAPGEADWDAPTDAVHRAVNVGSETFEEVVLFFLDEPGQDHQPAVP